VASSLPRIDCSSGSPRTPGPRRSTVSTPARRLRPGVVLIREWRGTSHQVTVLEDGVLFRGKRHRSLSAVARKITGNCWSGPLFFGLKAPVQENHDGTR
jgi:Protein of unknown function (DUF2924)